MSDIPAALARAVRERASERCEYCGLHQSGQEATFHVDHIPPKVQGGQTIPENLALACVSCSLRKGGQAEAADPQTGHRVRLFHPREQVWGEHFRVDGETVVGLTPTGRATVGRLQMNRQRSSAIRRLETRLGRFPPPATWMSRQETSTPQTGEE